MAAAVATVAALLLAVAALAAAPVASIGALTGARIAFLGEAVPASCAADSAHPALSGFAAPRRTAARRDTRATLAAHAAVLLRHTSLPPPAAA
jgi:hypothetical protein